MSKSSEANPGKTKKNKKQKKNKKEPKKQYFGTLGKLPLNFQESRNIVFFGSFGFFGFVFFCFFGFVFFWFFLDWFCRNLEISLIPFLYYTVQFITLIELSIFRNFYCSWQLMPNLLGLVLVFCFLFA